MRFDCRLGWIALLGLALSSAFAAQPDGPYVLLDADGWQAVSVAVQGDTASRQSRPLKEGESVRIPAQGSAPPFSVKLRPPASDAADAVTTAAKAPVFVVADTHGEYEILISMLRAHKVLGAKLEWKFGRGHLVVLGDVFDRGPHHLEILWLLYKLEAEARKAGGGAHLVLGNHEMMAMRGDLRYLHPKYLETASLLQVPNYSQLFAADSLLGQWLRTRPAMLVVNDTLCLHAGISRALVDSGLTLTEINQTIRSVLRDEPGQGAMAELVTGTLGPLWYRGYFAGQSGFPPATDQDVALTLATFGVRRILIGHTIVPTVTPLYQGKVIAVQVYPKRDESGKALFESLLIRNGQPWRATLDGRLQTLQ
jgi:Calcineurin-like phosphoesterase